MLYGQQLNRITRVSASAVDNQNRFLTSSRLPSPGKPEALKGANKNMSKVFVLDTNKQQLNPVNPGRARTLLDSGKAAIFKRAPFTIILTHHSHHFEGGKIFINIF